MIGQDSKVFIGGEYKLILGPQYTTVGMIMSFIGSIAFKSTLLSLYLRLFKPNRWAFWLIWAGIAVVAIIYAACCIVVLVTCVPRSNETWQDTTEFGACTRGQRLTNSITGIFGVFSDLYILVIPLWQVSRLRLAPRRKVGVLAVFLTGLL